MRLVRCDACGAKAILAASQCPKCAEPLYVRNERGDDVRLVSCRSCETYYPASRDGCRWCPAVERAPIPRWTGKVVVTVLTIAASWGGWQFLPASTPPSPAPNVMTLQPAPVPRLASVAVVPSHVEHSVQRTKVLPVSATATRAPEVTKPASSAAATRATGAPTSSAVEQSRPTRTTGSTDLVSAKATTWVNVRAEANGVSAIVGIILPDSIVELGESRRGWRRVSTRWFSGWASAKLFTVDSLGR
jgi:hypothetical protein